MIFGAIGGAPASLNVTMARNMLGLEDPTILFGYGLTIGLTIACIAYGWLKKDEEE